MNARLFTSTKCSFEIRSSHGSKMSTVVFWVVTPCSLTGSYQRFIKTYCLHLQSLLHAGNHLQDCKFSHLKRLQSMLLLHIYLNFNFCFSLVTGYKQISSQIRSISSTLLCKISMLKYDINSFSDITPCISSWYILKEMHEKFLKYTLHIT
jgi:hypothetical protein